MEILFLGEFVVKVPFTGALPEVHAVGEPITVPGGEWDTEVYV